MNRSFKKTESHLGLQINPKKPLTIGVTCPFLLTGPTYFFFKPRDKRSKKKDSLDKFGHSEDIKISAS